MAREKKKPARKKRTRKKPSKQTSRTKSPPKFDLKNPSVDELQQVFAYWCKSNRNIQKTAIHFSVSRNGIKSCIERYDWNTRFNKVVEQAYAQTESTIAGGLAENVQTAQKVFDKIAKKLLDKDAAISADPFALIRVGKYIDDVSGDTPQTTTRDIIINVVDQLTEAGPAERDRFARNYLAGLGIFDDAAVSRMSKILPCKLHSQN